MAKEFAKRLYASKQWAQCRASYIESVHGLCEICLKQNTIKPGYIVHHKIELSPKNINDPSITLSHGNLMYCCHDCHNGLNAIYTDVLRDGLMFDDDGNVINKLQLDGK